MSQLFHIVTTYVYRKPTLLYLLVSARAVIGQFRGPYSPIRPAKIKLVLLQNCFVIYRQVFLTFIASKSLKHSLLNISLL